MFAPGHDVNLTKRPTRDRPLFESKDDYSETLHAHVSELSTLHRLHYASTSTRDNPWYIVPADDKDDARLIVSQIVLDAFNSLAMAYPEATRARRRELARARRTSAKDVGGAFADLVQT